jgi:hypothetical protein
LLLTGTVKLKNEERNSLDDEKEVVINLNQLVDDEEIKIFGEFNENEVRLICIKKTSFLTNRFVSSIVLLYSQE